MEVLGKRSESISISERLLLALSRDSSTQDRKGTSAGEEWTVGNSLSFLRNAFPNFEAQIAGRDILDFGCGLGYQVVGLALAGANSVTGIEINPAWQSKARALARVWEVQDKTEIAPGMEDRLRGKFDIAFSQSSFEHFSDPAAIIRQMRSALKPGGKLYITFYGPWYSPYGAHMQFFTGVPWVNVLFTERTVMAARSRFRNDGATRYEEVTSGLNKMSLAKFESIVKGEGLKVEYRKYRCIKGLPLLDKIPVIRELLVNQVNCILKEEF